MCNLVGIALLVRMYTKVWKENIFVTVSIYVVGMMCDAFVTFLFIPYKDGNMYNQVYGAIGILLMFVCELIAGRIVSGQKTGQELIIIFDLYTIMQYFIGNDIDLYKKQHL